MGETKNNKRQKLKFLLNEITKTLEIENVCDTFN